MDTFLLVIIAFGTIFYSFNSAIDFRLFEFFVVVSDSFICWSVV